MSCNMKCINVKTTFFIFVIFSMVFLLIFKPVYYLLLSKLKESEKDNIIFLMKKN